MMMQSVLVINWWHRKSISAQSILIVDTFTTELQCWHFLASLRNLLGGIACTV